LTNNWSKTKESRQNQEWGSDQGGASRNQNQWPQEIARSSGNRFRQNGHVFES